MRYKTKKRLVKSSRKRRSKSKKMRGSGLTPSRKGTLPRDNSKQDMLTDVALEYLRDSNKTKNKPSSPSPTPSPIKVDPKITAAKSELKAAVRKAFELLRFNQVIQIVKNVERESRVDDM